MTALFDCTCGFRAGCCIAFLLCIVLTFSVLVYVFLNRKTIHIVLNFFALLSECSVLALFSEVTERKIGHGCFPIMYTISQKPVWIFLALVLFAVALTALSMAQSKPPRIRVVIRQDASAQNTLLCLQAEQLQKDNIRLTEMNRRMQTYGEAMQAQIKQREILQAKETIHNGMNRLLMISSRALESGNREDIEKAMALWHNDALLLCKEAENMVSPHFMQDIHALAKALDLHLSCRSIPIFPDEATTVLFVKAACEAMINAVKHADADTFTITGTETGFRFTNNGDLPQEEIRFGGGLSAIASLAKQAGFAMTIEAEPQFTLIFEGKQES